MEKLTIDEIIGHCERKTEQYERFHKREYLETMPLTSSAIKEYWEHRQVAEYLRKLKDYENLEERLNKIYGDCDGLLESMVELLEEHSGIDIPDDTVKVLLITNESVDFYKKCKSLEEQDRLIKLPCNIGDDVWFVPSQANYKLNILNHHSKANRVYHQKVAKITFSMNGWYLECEKDLEYATGHIFIDKMYEETWFLTKSEAEAKLEELGGGEK